MRQGRRPPEWFDTNDQPAIPRHQREEGKRMTRLALTVAEAARELAVSETTVYRLAQAGDIPCRKVRGQWRIPRQPLMDWLEGDPSDRQKPTPR